jgi:hypothetical protein
MANKGLRTRQKLVFRGEPSQLKPRNPFAVPAGQRKAGTHRKNASALRQRQKLALKKSDDGSGEE